MELSTRPFKIEWWNFSSEPDEALFETLQQIRFQLPIRYPQLPKFDLVPLSRDLVHGLKDYMVSQLPGKDPWMDWEPYTSRLIFVFCEPKDPLVHVFQQENPLAHWGVAIPAQFSIAWHYDRFLIWHELMHLFNAKDCYNKFGINKCSSGNCLMRRDPSRLHWQSEWVICSKNQKRMTEYARSVQAKVEG